MTFCGWGCEVEEEEEGGRGRETCIVATHAIKHTTPHEGEEEEAKRGKES